MPIINDPNIAKQIADLALNGNGNVDSDAVIALLNQALPAGQQVAQVDLILIPEFTKTLVNLIP